MSQRPAAPPRERDQYAVFTPLATRWMDNDQFGHLNNVVYYSYFDTAVNATLIAELGFDPADDPAIFYVVETGCTFYDGISWPTPVEVGARLARLGGSSVTYELAVFAQGAELAAATGRFVHVYVDRVTERPVAIGEALRAGLLRVYGDGRAGAAGE